METKIDNRSVMGLLNFDNEKLYSILTEKCGWIPSVAKAACKSLVKLDNRLQIPLDRWLKGEEADFP
jgi:hypothetical protein